MKLLVIDDHPLFREGLKFLLRTLDRELVIDEAGDCQQALAFSSKLDYDLVLLDLKMPGVRGMDALEAVRASFALVPIVVVAGEHTAQLVRDAIDRGAMGFIPKSSTPEQLVRALELVLGNKVYLPDDVLAKEPPGSELAELTPRQIEVLRSVIQGKPNKVVARELGVSADTVKSHLAALMRTLNVHNRTELVYVAARRGLHLG